MRESLARSATVDEQSKCSPSHILASVIIFHGTSAQVKAREFTVIVKGLSVQRLRAIHDPEQVVNELKKRTAGINRCKVQLSRAPGSRYAMVILYMNSVVAAQEVCRRGVVFEAQYFSTEPFYAATSPSIP